MQSRAFNMMATSFETQAEISHSSAAASHAPGRCRFCGTKLSRTFVDLGMSPLCESYPSLTDLSSGEMYYPLHVFLCDRCLLVQLEEFESAEHIFREYAYFSSYSDSWLKHAKSYCEQMSQRFQLGRESFVVEVASNDG